MGQVTAMNIITFTDDKLTLGGTGHVNSLHINVEYKWTIVDRVIIDNGSVLNVSPLMTLKQIGSKRSIVLPNGMKIWTFDGSKTVDLGKIKLKVLTRPCELRFLYCC